MSKEHESYGLVLFSRTHGTVRKLFGSAIRDHGTTIRLSVVRASYSHTLGRDWHGTAGRLPLVEVELSAAQLAELLTTMNVGSGVPCTIRFAEGRRMEEPPDDENESERVRTSFKQDIENLAKGLEEYRKQVRAILKKPSITKKDREEISKGIDQFIQDIAADMPFMLEQFQEATEKVVTAAKAETEAFITHAVHSAGLDALRQRADALAEGEETKRLPEKK